MTNLGSTDTVSDEQHLAKLGYKQELGRSLGSFSTFATGFAFISILTGAFQLFFFSYDAAGPAFWWTWVIAFAGQMLFALCFAELSAHYPMAGSVYNWAKQVGSRTTSWIAGWSFTLALIVSTAGVALAMQFVLPTISNVFWLYGDGSGEYDAATNGVILGVIAIVLTTTVNSLGARITALINNIGVIVELVASVLLIVFFFAAAKRGPQVVLTTQGHATGHALGVPGALLAAVLLGVYIMWGFDTAGSLGEETLNPRRNSPRAIIRALFAAGLSGALLMLAALMATPDLNAPELSTNGLPYIVEAVLGPVLGKILLAAVAIAIFVCILANQTGAMRMIFAMSRDNALPASARLASISKVTKAPVLTAIICGLIAIIVLLVNVRQPQIFVVVTSTTVVLAFISYVLVAATFTRRRLSGHWVEDRRYFSLGRLGVPIGVAAVAWGTLVIVNLSWPRADGFALRWGPSLIVIAVIGLGTLYYWLVQRHKVGILPQHAAVVDPLISVSANAAANDLVPAPEDQDASTRGRPQDPPRR